MSVAKGPDAPTNGHVLDVHHESITNGHVPDAHHEPNTTPTTSTVDTEKQVIQDPANGDAPNADKMYIEAGISGSESHGVTGAKYTLLMIGYHFLSLHPFPLSLCFLNTNQLSLFLSIFLVNFEITVISTSLVSITNSLQDFRRSSWIITGYLLTYVAFMVILAKLSDLIGRKTVLVASLAVFTLFSGICGAAQTMTQLIVFRAFQGLGGSGVYSLVMVILFELVEPAKFAAYTAMMMGTFAISFLVGPVIGGAIGDNTTWRWVFLLNVPAGAFALVVLVFCIPNGFPHHGKPKKTVKEKSKFGRLDIIGTTSLLVFIMLLIVGLEGVSEFEPWVSARVLAPILISVVALAVFLWYERLITMRERPEPVYPWRFVVDRVIMATFTYVLTQHLLRTMKEKKHD